MIRNHQFKPSVLAATIAALGLTGLVNAQQATLEEITVTAQKREESLKDVPISLTVVDANRIEAANINKVADLVQFVPNLSMTETGVSTQLYVRGIGSGNNQGFEQSVGQYVDDVYYGRQMLIRAPYLDLSRIEVLRGPQSTLFGKNTIAGAINYTTAKPTDTREIKLDALQEFESDQTELTFVASGPLTDTFRARFAWRGYEEDGYEFNTFTKATEPNRDENTYRLTLGWDISPDVEATLKWERNEFETRGRQIEIVMDMPNLIPASASPMGGKNLSQILQLFGQPGVDGVLDFNRQANDPEKSINNMDNKTLTINYDYNGYKLTSVTGRVAYDFDENCDCDYTAANIFNVRLGETYSQISQELRLASPGGGKFEWLAGLYWQHAEMTSLEVLNVPGDSFVRTLAAASPDPSQRALAGLLNTRLWRDNGQDSENDALFFQGKWNLRDDLRLTVGGRYTREDKSGFRRMNIYDYNTLQPVTNGVAARVWFGAFKIYTEQLKGLTLAPGVVGLGHDLSGSRQENQFTPMVNLEWDYNDQTMLYATASSGYKAGGFDGRANNPFSFEFEEENARAYEIGSKNVLFNRALEFNIAYFFTDYRDLQVSQFDGTFGFNVGNAEKAKVQGIEIDGRWAINDAFTLNYSYSWLDFEFTDFKDGNCYNRQVPNGLTVNGVRMCDYTGRDGQYTPENSASLALDYHHALFGDVMLVGSLMFNYRDSQKIHDNHDPNMIIESVGRTDLRLGLEAERWHIGFVGKNLTNEKVLTYAGNVPLSAGIFGTNTFYGMVDRPRQYAIVGGVRF